MTRRTAFQLLATYIGGFMATSTHAQQPTRPKQQQSTLALSLSASEPQTLTCYLDWKSITVVHKGERLTIDPAEMFAALKGPSPHPADPEARDRP